MSIEHRWAARQAAALPVSLTCRSFGLLRGRLCDISHGGARVQLSTPLPPNAPVEIVLGAHPPGGRVFRLSGIVTRCDEEGVGLMFDRVAPEVWLALSAHLFQNRESEGVREPVAGGLPASASR